MIILYLISVWGGDPVYVDKYDNMEHCKGAMAQTQADANGSFYRLLCVPSRSGVK